MFSLSVFVDFHFLDIIPSDCRKRAHFRKWLRETCRYILRRRRCLRWIFRHTHIPTCNFCRLRWPAVSCLNCPMSSSCNIGIARDHLHWVAPSAGESYLPNRSIALIRRSGNRSSDSRETVREDVFPFECAHARVLWRGPPRGEAVQSIRSVEWGRQKH